MIVFLIIFCITGIGAPSPELSTQEHALVLFQEIGREDEFSCAAYIFERESRWDSNAVGDNGASWGLGQRNTRVWGMPPLPWSIKDQVDWFTWYADNRYGGWCEAMENWKRNREAYGWGWW